jgi:hypothetical protein
MYVLKDLSITYTKMDEKAFNKVALNKMAVPKMVGSFKLYQKTVICTLYT